MCWITWGQSTFFTFLLISKFRLQAITWLHLKCIGSWRDIWKRLGGSWRREEFLAQGRNNPAILQAVIWFRLMINCSVRWLFFRREEPASEPMKIDINALYGNVMSDAYLHVGRYLGTQCDIGTMHAKLWRGWRVPRPWHDIHTKVLCCPTII